MLLFHGGSGHKRSGRHLRMGHRLASTASLAAIAIDGPYHGDRVPAPMAPAVYQQLIGDEGIDRLMARMIEDWLDAVSALAARELTDDANVSVSRCRWEPGSHYRSRPRLDHACGALCSASSESARPSRSIPGSAPRPDDRRACYLRARALSCSVGRCALSRNGQFELFGALASGDKHLVARSGPHAETHPDDETSWQEFIGHVREGSVPGAVSLCGVAVAALSDSARYLLPLTDDPSSAVRAFRPVVPGHQRTGIKWLPGNGVENVRLGQ